MYFEVKLPFEGESIKKTTKLAKQKCSQQEIQDMSHF